jgi:hypothetical protein
MIHLPAAELSLSESSTAKAQEPSAETAATDDIVWAAKFDTRFHRRFSLTAHVQLRRIFFPAPVAADLRTAVAADSGPEYPYILDPKLGETAYDGAHRIAWLDGTFTWRAAGQGNTNDGRPCEVALTVMSWYDEKGSNDFKKWVDMPKLDPDTGVFLGTVNVMDAWDEKLREWGAVGWSDIYVDFQQGSGWQGTRR